MKDKIKVGDSRHTFLQLCRNFSIGILEFLGKIPPNPQKLSKKQMRSPKKQTQNTDATQKADAK